MIHVNNHEITGVYSGFIDISAVYSGLKLVCRKIKETTEVLYCYYNGYWIDEYPWTDDTTWTD